jgi:hypothetical protein
MKDKGRSADATAGIPAVGRNLAGWWRICGAPLRLNIIFL